MENETQTKKVERRSIADIMDDFPSMPPKDWIKSKPATGRKGSDRLYFVPWYRVQKAVNAAAHGHVSYTVMDRTISDGYVWMTVRITVHALEGSFHRDGTGICALKNTPYGDPQSNAESMAFRRAAARFGFAIDLYEKDDDPPQIGGTDTVKGKRRTSNREQSRDASTSQLETIRTAFSEYGIHDDRRITSAICNRFGFKIRALEELSRDGAKTIIAAMQQKKK